MKLWNATQGSSDVNIERELGMPRGRILGCLSIKGRNLKKVGMNEYRAVLEYKQFPTLCNGRQLLF
jgi:hypothetical protein